MLLSTKVFSRSVLLLAAWVCLVPISQADDAKGPILTLKGHKGQVNCVAFSDDGCRAASGGEDVRVRDLETGKELCRFEGHTESILGPKSVLSVAFSPDGSKVVSGGIDKTVRLWDVGSKKEIRRLEGHKSGVQSLAFSADGRKILSSGSSIGSAHGETLRVWDAETGKEVRRHVLVGKGYFSPLARVVFSTDGKLALVRPGGLDGTSKIMRVYSLHDGKVKQEIKVIWGAMALSRDGHFALSTGDDLSIRCWDVKTGKELHTFQGPRQKVMAISISPDNKRALSDHEDGAVRLWDIETGKELLMLHSKRGRHPSTRHNITFSPDGRRALSAWYKDVIMWDVTTK